MKPLNVILLILACFCFAFYPQNANGEYHISNSVIGNGGIVQTGAKHSIIGTVGQPVEGISTCISYNTCFGYWYIDNRGFVPILVDDISYPDSFRLLGNYPNPFNPSTNIQFELPEESHVRFDIYSISGQKVITLMDSQLGAGSHVVKWEPDGLSAGLYVYSLRTGNKSETGKMLYLK